MLTDCADAKFVNLASTHFREYVSSAHRQSRCKNRSIKLLHISDSEYKVMTDCADATVGQFSLYKFQRGSVK